MQHVASWGPSTPPLFSVSQSVLWLPPNLGQDGWTLVGNLQEKYPVQSAEFSLRCITPSVIMFENSRQFVWHYDFRSGSVPHNAIACPKTAFVNDLETGSRCLLLPALAECTGLVLCAPFIGQEYARSIVVDCKFDGTPVSEDVCLLETDVMAHRVFMKKCTSHPKWVEFSNSSLFTDGPLRGNPQRQHPPGSVAIAPFDRESRAVLPTNRWVRLRFDLMSTRRTATTRMYLEDELVYESTNTSDGLSHLDPNLLLPNHFALFRTTLGTQVPNPNLSHSFESAVSVNFWEHVQPSFSVYVRQAWVIRPPPTPLVSLYPNSLARLYSTADKLGELPCVIPGLHTELALLRADPDELYEDQLSRAHKVARLASPEFKHDSPDFHGNWHAFVQKYGRIAFDSETGQAKECIVRMQSILDLPLTPEGMPLQNEQGVPIKYAIGNFYVPETALERQLLRVVDPKGIMLRNIVVCAASEYSRNFAHSVALLGHLRLIEKQRDIIPMQFTTSLRHDATKKDRLTTTLRQLLHESYSQEYLNRRPEEIETLTTVYTDLAYLAVRDQLLKEAMAALSAGTAISELAQSLAASREVALLEYVSNLEAEVQAIAGTTNLHELVVQALLGNPLAAKWAQQIAECEAWRQAYQPGDVAKVLAGASSAYGDLLETWANNPELHPLMRVYDQILSLSFSSIGSLIVKARVSDARAAALPVLLPSTSIRDALEVVALHLTPLRPLPYYSPSYFVVGDVGTHQDSSYAQDSDVGIMPTPNFLRNVQLGDALLQKSLLELERAKKEKSEKKAKKEKKEKADKKDKKDKKHAEIVTLSLLDEYLAEEGAEGTSKASSDQTQSAADTFVGLEQMNAARVTASRSEDPVLESRTIQYLDMLALSLSLASGGHFTSVGHLTREIIEQFVFPIVPEPMCLLLSMLARLAQAIQRIRSLASVNSRAVQLSLTQRSEWAEVLVHDRVLPLRVIATERLRRRVDHPCSNGEFAIANAAIYPYYSIYDLNTMEIITPDSLKALVNRTRDNYSDLGLATKIQQACFGTSKVIFTQHLRVIKMALYRQIVELIVFLCSRVRTNIPISLFSQLGIKAVGDEETRISNEERADALAKSCNVILPPAHSQLQLLLNLAKSLDLTAHDHMAVLRACKNRIQSHIYHAIKHGFVLASAKVHISAPLLITKPQRSAQGIPNQPPPMVRALSSFAAVDVDVEEDVGMDALDIEGIDEGVGIDETSSVFLQALCRSNPKTKNRGSPPVVQAINMERVFKRDQGSSLFQASTSSPDSNCKASIPSSSVIHPPLPAPGGPTIEENKPESPLSSETETKFTFTLPPPAPSQTAMTFSFTTNGAADAELIENCSPPNAIPEITRQDSLTRIINSQLITDIPDGNDTALNPECQLRGMFMEIATHFGQLPYVPALTRLSQRLRVAITYRNPKQWIRIYPEFSENGALDAKRFASSYRPMSAEELAENLRRLIMFLGGMRVDDLESFPNDDDQQESSSESKASKTADKKDKKDKKDKHSAKAEKKRAQKQVERAMAKVQAHFGKKHAKTTGFIERLDPRFSFEQFRTRAPDAAPAIPIPAFLKEGVEILQFKPVIEACDLSMALPLMIQSVSQSANPDECNDELNTPTNRFQDAARADMRKAFNETWSPSSAHSRLQSILEQLRKGQPPTHIKDLTYEHLPDLIHAVRELVDEANEGKRSEADIQVASEALCTVVEYAVQRYFITTDTAYLNDFFARLLTLHDEFYEAEIVSPTWIDLLSSLGNSFTHALLQQATVMQQRIQAERNESSIGNEDSTSEASTSLQGRAETKESKDGSVGSDETKVQYLSPIELALGARSLSEEYAMVGVAGVLDQAVASWRRMVSQHPASALRRIQGEDVFVRPLRFVPSRITKTTKISDSLVIPPAIQIDVQDVPLMCPSHYSFRLTGRCFNGKHVALHRIRHWRLYGLLDPRQLSEDLSNQIRRVTTGFESFCEEGKFEVPSDYTNAVEEDVTELISQQVLGREQLSNDHDVPNDSKDQREVRNDPLDQLVDEKADVLFARETSFYPVLLDERFYPEAFDGSVAEINMRKRQMNSCPLLPHVDYIFEIDPKVREAVGYAHCFRGFIFEVADPIDPTNPEGKAPDEVQHRTRFEENAHKITDPAEAYPYARRLGIYAFDVYGALVDTNHNPFTSTITKSELDAFTSLEMPSLLRSQSTQEAVATFLDRVGMGASSQSGLHLHKKLAPLSRERHLFRMTLLAFLRESGLAEEHAKFLEVLSTQLGLGSHYLDQALSEMSLPRSSAITPHHVLSYMYPSGEDMTVLKRYLQWYNVHKTRALAPSSSQMASAVPGVQLEPSARFITRVLVAWQRKSFSTLLQYHTPDAWPTALSNIPVSVKLADEPAPETPRAVKVPKASDMISLSRDKKGQIRLKLHLDVVIRSMVAMDLNPKLPFRIAGQPANNVQVVEHYALRRRYFRCRRKILREMGPEFAKETLLWLPACNTDGSSTVGDGMVVDQSQFDARISTTFMQGRRDGEWRQLFGFYRSIRAPLNPYLHPTDGHLRSGRSRVYMPFILVRATLGPVQTSSMDCVDSYGHWKDGVKIYLCSPDQCYPIACVDISDRPTFNSGAVQHFLFGPEKMTNGFSDLGQFKAALDLVDALQSSASEPM